MSEGLCPVRSLTPLSPKVWSTKELDAAKKAAQFKMYEAVLSTGDKAIAPTETDAEIEKFLPLLKDYLNRAFVVALVRLLLTLSNGSERVCPSARPR